MTPDPGVEVADAYAEYIVRKRMAEAITEARRIRLDIDAIGFLFFFGWIIVLCWLGAWVFEKLGIGGGTYVDLLGPQVERHFQSAAPPVRRDVYNPRYRERRCY